MRQVRTFENDSQKIEGRVGIKLRIPSDEKKVPIFWDNRKPFWTSSLHCHGVCRRSSSIIVLFIQIEECKNHRYWFDTKDRICGMSPLVKQNTGFVLGLEIGPFWRGTQISLGYYHLVIAMYFFAVLGATLISSKSTWQLLCILFNTAEPWELIWHV